VITSKAELIKHTMALELGISDHKLVNTCLMTKIKRPPPKIVKARSYKHFDQSKFVKDIEEAPCQLAQLLTTLTTVIRHGWNFLMAYVIGMLPIKKLR
jgi:hypothetical protein